MNNFKRLIRLTGFVATLAAGIALSAAAIDGAGARDHGRENSGWASSPGRTEGHTAVTAKPAATGTKPAAKPIPTTKHAESTKPGHDDDHDHDHNRHHRHRSNWLSAWTDQQIFYCDCKYQFCRKSSPCTAACSTSSVCPIRRSVVFTPVAIAPEARPVYLGGDE